MMLPADPAPTALQRRMQAVEAAARRFDSEAFAPATRLAYARAWLAFEAWCQGHELASLPASIETVRLHLADLAGNRGLSTVATRQAAILLVHARAGHVFDDTARARLHITARGIRRSKRVHVKRQAPPLDAPAFAKLVAKIPPDIVGLRDRAIVAIGFEFFLRRSEISRIDMRDIEITESLIRLTLHQTKTLKGGRKLVLSRPRREDPARCMVAWVEAWLAAAGDLTEFRIDGEYVRPVFRAIDRFGRVQDTRLSGEAIRVIVRDRARDAGLDRTMDFSAHSLRAGGLTAALDGGLQIELASDQANQASVDTTRIYDRRKVDDIGRRASDATAAAFYPEYAPKTKGAPVRVDPIGRPEKVERAAADLARIVSEADIVVKRTKETPA